MPGGDKHLLFIDPAQSNLRLGGKKSVRVFVRLRLSVRVRVRVRVRARSQRRHISRAHHARHIGRAKVQRARRFAFASARRRVAHAAYKVA